MIPAPYPTVAPRPPLRTPGPTERPRGAVAEPVPTVLWWSLGDCSRALGYSTRQTRRLCAESGLPYSRVGRMLRFEPEAVRAWTRRFVVQGVGR